MSVLDSKLDKQDIKRLLKEHKDILDKYRVKTIGLFGSYVRGEQREDSDIDLLVEFYEPDYSNLVNLAYSLEELLNKKIEIVCEDGVSPYIEPYIKREVEFIET